MEKTIKLGCYGMEIHLEENGLGSITSDLKEVCQFCGYPDCDFLCMEAQEWASDRDIDCQNDKNEELRDKKNVNSMIDIVESMVLAHAIAGIDVESPAYIEGIETVVDGIGNNT